MMKTVPKRSIDIVSQVLKLANMRRSIMPNAQEFLVLLNEGLLRYEKVATIEDLDALERGDTVDVSTLGVYGMLLGCNVKFDNAANMVFGMPKASVKRAVKRLRRLEADLKYLSSFDGDTSQPIRVEIFMKQNVDDELRRIYVYTNGLPWKYIKQGMEQTMVAELDRIEKEINVVEGAGVQ